MIMQFYARAEANGQLLLFAVNLLVGLSIRRASIPGVTVLSGFCLVICAFCLVNVLASLILPRISVADRNILIHQNLTKVIIPLEKIMSVAKQPKGALEIRYDSDISSESLIVGGFVESDLERFCEVFSELHVSRISKLE